MLSNKPWTGGTLQQPCIGVGVVCGDHGHITSRLLHDHSEDDASIYVIVIRALVDGDLDVGDIGFGVSALL